MQVTTRRLFTFFILPVLALGAASAASLLEGKPLTTALAQGGYVFLMRHASSPATPPSATEAAPANVGRDRQLDEKGRASARAMGEALRHLKIPVGKVLSSTAYRALETAGEALIYRPDGHGKAALVARVKIEDWPKLAAAP